MAKMVKVYCGQINGLMIRLFKKGYDDGTGDGVSPMVADGPGVQLNGPSSLNTGAGATDRRDLPPGETWVDSEWIARWMEQNAQNPFVTGGLIYVGPEEEPSPQ